MTDTIKRKEVRKKTWCCIHSRVRSKRRPGKCLEHIDKWNVTIKTEMKEKGTAEAEKVRVPSPQLPWQ